MTDSPAARQEIRDGFDAFLAGDGSEAAWHYAAMAELGYEVARAWREDLSHPDCFPSHLLPQVAMHNAAWLYDNGHAEAPPPAFGGGAVAVGFGRIVASETDILILLVNMV
jgi:hypothetical protein